jgi:hypothetical protein
MELARKPIPDGPIKTAIRSIQEVPHGSSDVLVEIIAKVYQVTTAKIAYHEREAQKLRDSLKPYAGLSPRPNDAPIGGITDDDIRALSNLAAQLIQPGEPQS